MAAAGARNRPVRIERLATPVDDGQGGLVDRWEVIWRGFAKATPVAGKEALVAGTLRDAQPWRIEILRTDVTTADRIAADWLAPGFVIDIQSIGDMTGTGRDLVIFGEAVQA